MANRFYIMPKAGTGQYGDPYRMKYIDNADGTRQIVGQAAGMDYGAEPVFLVMADVTGAEHAAIAANPDVLAAPVNLNDNLGAQRDTVEAGLESFNIPGDWITAGMSYRQVLKWLTRLFQFMQKYWAMHHAKVFDDAAETWDLQWGDLPEVTQLRLKETAATYGVNTAKVKSTTSLRVAFRETLERVPVGVFGDL